ncbi:hypothetical protein BDV98DRAFT_470330, partial [Pterulicium gracile]
CKRPAACVKFANSMLDELEPLWDPRRYPATTDCDETDHQPTEDAHEDDEEQNEVYTHQKRNATQVSELFRVLGDLEPKRRKTPS